jgi:hypothetical protein
MILTGEPVTAERGLGLDLAAAISYEGASVSMRFGTADRAEDSPPSASAGDPPSPGTDSASRGARQTGTRCD